MSEWEKQREADWLHASPRVPYEAPEVLASYSREELESMVSPEGDPNGGCGCGCGCGGI